MKPIQLLRRILLIAILLSTTLFSFSQTRFTVSGKVTDGNGQPLEGVTVQERGTTNTTQTKQDGSFQLNVATGNAVLVLSSIGYDRREFVVNNTASLNLSLTAATGSMEDIVVVGYGSRKRVEVTGATTSVSGDNLRTVQTTNLTQALQGRVAGVTVTPNTFRPGAGASIRIRGNRSLSASNEPLYVVDGFPVSYTIDWDPLESTCRHASLSIL